MRKKFEKGKFELVILPKMTIGKAVYELWRSQDKL